MNYHDPIIRLCNICGTSSAEATFYRHVTSRCADCHKKKVRENRAANLEYYRAYDAKRYKEQPERREGNERRARTPKGKEAKKRYVKKWQTLNMVKRKAHNLVWAAIKAGRLVKPKACEVCGKEHRVIHGHHGDYSKPLDVIWVCPPCHMEFHR